MSASATTTTVLSPLPFGSNKVVFGKDVDPIDALNKRSFEIASQDKDNVVWTHILAGTPIYMRRYQLLVYCFATYASLAIISFTYNYGILPSLTMALILYVYSDFKGGNLHVVLDEPDNWNNPIFGEAAVEFQMHHAIPQDNYIKPFVEMCGDLNMLSSIILPLCLVVGGFDGVTAATSGYMLLFGYLGQWAHRMAHTPAKHRPAWAVTLQKMHILVPPSIHAKHHQTYDDNFCILSGWTGLLVGWMVRTIPSPMFWRNLFLFLTITDIALVSEFFRSSLV